MMMTTTCNDCSMIRWGEFHPPKQVGEAIRTNGWTSGRMDGWTSGRMDGWTSGRTDGWTSGFIKGRTSEFNTHLSLDATRLRGLIRGSTVLEMVSHMGQRNSSLLTLNEWRVTRRFSLCFRASKKLPGKEGRHGLETKRETLINYDN